MTAAPYLQVWQADGLASSKQMLSVLPAPCVRPPDKQQEQRVQARVRAPFVQGSGDTTATCNLVAAF